MTDRPGTGSGSRLETGSNLGRPGTRQNAPLARLSTGQRVPSASGSNRPLTGRLGTGMAVPSTSGQTAGIGLSLNTEVNVSDRPVTQQGMMGIRIGTAGPRRQIQDASYFMGILHTKVADITTEIERLHTEKDQDAKDKAQFAQLERKYETLSVSVRDLEGQLADCNLAMDKLRSGTDPSDVYNVREQLSLRNKNEAEEIDRIFLLRQEQEQACRKMDQEARDIHSQHEKKINQLAPQQLARYKEMLAEHCETEAGIELRTKELEHLISVVQKKELELGNDPYRDDFEKLANQLQRLDNEKRELQEEAITASMDPNEARAMLLLKVKQDKTRLEALEVEVQNASNENAELAKSCNELEADFQERTGSVDPSQKYEMLFQRDKEMTAFLESFPTKKESDLSLQSDSQNMIIKLLEHIANGLSNEEKVLLNANASNLEELKNDVSFKERQLESSVITKQRLTSELEKRRQELDRMNALDSKIAMELTHLHEKMDTMTSDMNAFERLEDMKDTHQHTKQYLQHSKQQYLRRRDGIKPQVHLLLRELEALREESSNNDTAKAMSALEQKLRHQEQTIFHLREYLESKSREVDYEATRQQCLSLVQEVNLLRIKQLQM
uniref:Intraflagellar Transport Protein 72/74 putative n=1 Tax=Albugo laibachii Nc14 TaxID=890382 RepID=F0WJQ4_9STRA|nr:Intraflagellar Transport Protein 72/74 putative [Albugo laibachii Nc14]|eukprot:CCA21505.1 Intraflagellar Transport Protein 72/74 putative [Albugo laibachii Nc14]